MNDRSHICRFIQEHPNTWEKDLEEKDINIKQEDELCIFTYGVSADFSDPIVQEARGIIIDLRDLKVICWPFRKFGNYSESYADKIDWSTARVQEKIDGSIIKYFYNPYTYQWQWATNSTINAKNAPADMITKESFLDIIKKADNYTEILNYCKVKGLTYIFELTSPQTQVVIKYPKAHLTHIGLRDNESGKEYHPLYVLDTPKEYKLTSLDDCIKAAEELNPGNDTEHEGFVVVDNNWNRIKIKSPQYLVCHRIVNNNILTKKRILQVIRSGENISNMCDSFPLHALYLKYYDFKYTEYKYKAQKIVVYARALYEEFNHDRKAVAKILSKDPLNYIGFMALDKLDEDFEVLFNEIPLSRIEKSIQDY